MTSLNKSERDNDLLIRLSVGDEEAFSEVYNLYAASLIRFAGSKLSSLEEAKDLIHDVFVYLWVEQKRIHIHTSLQTYLFGITRHKIIDHIRKNITREEYANKLRALSLDMECRIEKDIHAKELNRTVEKALEELPPRTKEIYQLSRNENKSIAEISELLHISNQTVKNQLTSALKFLRSSLTRLTTFLLFVFLFS